MTTKLLFCNVNILANMHKILNVEKNISNTFFLFSFYLLIGIDFYAIFNRAVEFNYSFVQYYNFIT